jgi:DNA-binding response OmpR family regulator
MPGVEILLVEDSPHDAELVMRALRKHNLANDVVIMNDGAKALEYLFGNDGDPDSDPHKPRVVLLDLKLPKVSGIEVLRKIKESEELKNVPVVVLTSSAEERDLVDSYELGVNSYIVKPIDFDAFSRAVAEVGLYWLLLNKAPT